MRILFVHQNFPGQFRHLSRMMASRGDTVVALAMNGAQDCYGAQVINTVAGHSTGAAHPWARDFDTKVIRGEATLHTALRLRQEGFVPDVILAHPGWGDTLFLKDVWPESRLAIYCEFFYRATDSDLDYDPEFSANETATQSRIRMRLRNLPQRLHFDVADAGIAPTLFQADSYPASIRGRIAVIHDGIDTDSVAPGPGHPMHFPDGRILTPGDEIVTFVSRTLEPYRGIHTLLRAWPAIQQARPAARLVIVGSKGTGYGAAPPKGKDWASIFLAEMGAAIDPARVLFTGPLDYRSYLNILRLSSLHIYLTYPFVLSWSLLEAMASGCAILASDTAPVCEFVHDDRTGLLTSFLDPAALSARAIYALADAALRHRLGQAARAHVLATVDLRTIAGPNQMRWIDSLSAAAPRAGYPDF